MKISKKHEEVRVKRWMEFNTKRMEVAKYTFTAVSGLEDFGDFKLVLEVAKDKFKFRKSLFPMSYGMKIPEGCYHQSGYVFRDINEFENQPINRKHECIIPKEAILNDHDDYIELDDLIVQELQLEQYVFILDAAGESSTYQVITEEFLRSKYPPKTVITQEI